MRSVCTSYPRDSKIVLARAQHLHGFRYLLFILRRIQIDEGSDGAYFWPYLASDYGAFRPLWARPPCLGRATLCCAFATAAQLKIAAASGKKFLRLKNEERMMNLP